MVYCTEGSRSIAVRCLLACASVGGFAVSRYSVHPRSTYLRFDRGQRRAWVRISDHPSGWLQRQKSRSPGDAVFSVRVSGAGVMRGLLHVCGYLSGGRVKDRAFVRALCGFLGVGSALFLSC